MSAPQLHALARLLLDSGDITPTGARMLAKVADDVRPSRGWCLVPRGMHRCTLPAGHDDLHHCCCVVNWAEDEAVEP